MQLQPELADAAADQTSGIGIDVVSELASDLIELVDGLEADARAHRQSRPEVLERLHELRTRWEQLLPPV